MSDMTNFENANLEELESRLKTFKEQLSGVETLVQAEPNNTEFINLKKDLMEIIQLNEQMIEHKQNQLSTEDIGEHEDIVLSPYHIGNTVDVYSKGSWYPAMIDDNKKSPLHLVTFLGYGNTEEIDLSSIRKIEPIKLIDESKLVVGFECVAKYFADEKYYPCRIMEVTPMGYKVCFEGYGNTEEVPHEYMCLMEDFQAMMDTNQPKAIKSTNSSTLNNPSTSSSSTKSATSVPVTKTIKIPEHLAILPTDTEEEKERKRKRIRAIKSSNRHKYIDQERNKKQEGWKSFQSKVNKRKTKTSAIRKKSSIFASPDCVDGKVGVVGSGQGMTHFDDTRKRYKLN